MARNTRSVGYVLLTCKYHQEGHKWVALCDELGTATFGRSLPDAERKLREAIQLHLETLEELGETERFFKENSIRICGEIPKDMNICVDVPSEDVFFRAFIQPIKELSAV